jgi:hypothetical protein
VRIKKDDAIAEWAVEREEKAGTAKCFLILLTITCDAAFHHSSTWRLESWHQHFWITTVERLQWRLSALLDEAGCGDCKTQL